MAFDMRTLDWDKRIDALTFSATMDAYNSALRRAIEETMMERTVVWITQKDELVCFICGTLHGSEWDIADADGLLPAHPYCRCTWAPLSEYEASLK